MPKKLKDLPSSDKKGFWGKDGESHISKPIPIPICKTHSRKNWTEHVGYVDNHNGMATCKFCPWGFMIPGYMRVLKGKVFDLRDG